MKENVSPNILKCEDLITSQDKINKVNKEQILKLFISESEEINSKNEVGWTPLYRTIVADNPLATEILLEMGADPNVQCNVRINFDFKFN
jgi:ankyrin repeat protein